MHLQMLDNHFETTAIFPASCLKIDIDFSAIFSIPSGLVKVAGHSDVYHSDFWVGFQMHIM